MEVLNTPFNWQVALCLVIVVAAICVSIARLAKAPKTEDPVQVEVDAEPITEPLPHRNPLVVRMYERWQVAQEAGDREARLRQEIRMLRAGIEPPVSLEECTAAIKAMKGEP